VPIAVKKPSKPSMMENAIGHLSQTSDQKPGKLISFLPSQGSKSTVTLTEDDVAEDFAHRHGQDLRFDHDLGKWFRWNGSCWEMNNTGLAFDYARHLCREHRGDRTTMASKKAAEGVEHIARRDQRLAVNSDRWDRDPYLLGTPGGTVDLRTGEIRDAEWKDFITKRVAVIPAAPEVTCNVFKKFLDDATGGDKEFQRFLQQWAGYCLTGDTREQALLFIYGPGGNGKSLFQGVLAEIMAHYAVTAAMDTFVSSKHPRHLTELAMLHGARVVTASETEKDQLWSESRINQLTGGDRITANFMRQDHFSFQPLFKLTLIGNHRPKLGSVNDAVRRRFNIVPFDHKPTAPDKMLREKLRAEYPAILRWMIDGCLDWQGKGLIRPEIVTATTDKYFEEQDLLGRWIEERCECGPAMRETATKLYESWRVFAVANGEPAGSQTVFGSALLQRNFERKKSGVMQYLGIQLKSGTSAVKQGPNASSAV
jgi:putative DNA primase/helicase